MPTARLYLHLAAPFAAFRTPEAGAYRTTAPTAHYTALYGLLCNLAGVELRTEDSRGQVVLREDGPVLRLAVGEVAAGAGTSTLYQQLHAYPVGNGPEVKAAAARCHGQKPWVTPVRREVLVDWRALVAVEAEADFLMALRAGLRGEVAHRYGLPFAGSNQHLLDVAEEVAEGQPARWYTRLQRGERRAGVCRLTTRAQRDDYSHNTWLLVAPEEEARPVPPEGAWVVQPA